MLLVSGFIPQTAGRGELSSRGAVGMVVTISGLVVVVNVGEGGIAGRSIYLRGVIVTFFFQ